MKDNKKYDLFISHASEDKEAIVFDTFLTYKLSNMGPSAWEAKALLSELLILLDGNVRPTA